MMRFEFQAAFDDARCGLKGSLKIAPAVERAALLSFAACRSIAPINRFQAAQSSVRIGL